MPDFYNAYNNPYGATYNPLQTQQFARPYSSSTYTAPVTQTQPQPIDGLIRVTGIDGAKAYQLPPNSSIALFDANNDIFYIKTTDGAGFPSIRAFSFAPMEATQPDQPASSDYVQRSEFEALAAQVRGLINAEQPISDAGINGTNGTTRRQSKQQPN